MEWIIWAFFLIMFYLLPSWIAGRRWVQQTALITFMNLIFWWTWIWWVVCLIWALVWKTHKDKEFQDLQMQLMRQQLKDKE